MAGFLMLLCLKQPDFGGAVVLLFLTFTLLFVAGARLGYLLGAGDARRACSPPGPCVHGLSLGAHAGLVQHGRAPPGSRVPTVPIGDELRLGRGRGLGLGKGLQVLYLPEAHTDFISAIIGEELGFIGILALCACSW